MTDEKNKDAFDLDWDDALSDWERDVDTSAEAKSKPMPQKPPPKPPAPPARALYQPPDPAEIARMRQKSHPSFAVEDASEPTVMTNVPSVPRALPTAPPPAMRGDDPPRATQRPTSPELDLDDLLANLDEETRHYPAELPKVAAAPKPPPPKPALPRPGAPPAPPRPRSPLLKPGGVPKPPPAPPASRPDIELKRDSFQDDLADLEASLSSPTAAAVEPPRSTPDETDALDALLFGDGGHPPEAHSAPTPVPPPARSAPAPAPVAPAAASPSLDDLDMELDAALGAFGDDAPAPQALALAAPAPAAPEADTDVLIETEAEAPAPAPVETHALVADALDAMLAAELPPAQPEAAHLSELRPESTPESTPETAASSLESELFGPPSGESAASPAAPLMAPVAPADAPIAAVAQPPVEVKAAPEPVRADRGAQAARRTVRSRKPRREVFPLVGRQPSALAARAELLEMGAAEESVSPASRARALLASAELRLQLGELEAVAELVARAATLDPQSIAVVRMARAVAVARRDVPAVAEQLEREAALLGDEERSERAVLLAAAADAWARAGDAERATAAGRGAYEAHPTLLTSLVALGHSASAPSVEGAYDVLRTASGGALARAILANAAARAVARGASAPVGMSHEPAIALRALGAQTDPGARVAALESLAASLEDDVAEAARLLELVERGSSGDDEALRDAARQLGREGQRPASLAFALDRAIQAGAAEEAALSERLAGHLEGRERAALLARASLLLSARGDIGDGEALARAAAAADASSGAVVAARTRLADLDPTRRAQRVQAEGALVVAAKLAREPGGLAQERELFEQAVARGEASATAEVLYLDALAAHDEERAVDEALCGALRRSAREGAPGASRAGGALLAAALLGDTDAAREAFAAAPAATSARARAIQAETAVDAADAWHDEASRASGEAAARAERESARALMDVDAAQATERLAASGPGDLAAAALFAVLADRDGAPAARAQALARYAALDRDPEARARASLRAALAALEAGDGEQTRALLARAAADAPDDPILDLMRWRDATGNGAAIPDDVVRRRREAGEGAVADALRVHTSLVLGVAPEAPGEAAPTSVAEHARAEAQHRASRLEESRRPVVAPATVAEAAGDLASLRAIERQRAVSLAGLDEVAFAIAEQVSDPADRTPYLREAYAASLRSAPSDEVEARFLVTAREAARDPWLARRAAGLALRRRDRALARVAGLEVAESLSAPIERATAAMHAMAPDLVDEVGAARDGIEVLRAFHAGAPEHPLLAEQLAALAALAGDHEAAAGALEQAARSASAPSRKARLFVAAADAHEEMGGDPQKVIADLEEASKADVTYGQVFERLRSALERVGDQERLSGLVARRLAAGGDGAQAATLYLAQASLREAANDIEGARAALRSALEHTTVEGSPEQLGALKKLAQLSLADEDYRGAAEALIRLAKLRREVEELRWIFFELAGIYDRHIPDVKRAEAAYRRVLKLVPDDTPAMERLAELYRRENMHPQAIEMLESLLKVEMDPDRARAHRLALARIHEQAGDARRAEQTLETTRRASPTDLETLRALADFYGRQKAQTALAMHLNRAAQDFRHALSADLTDEAAWIGLVEVLAWRGRHDAARAAATAAVALGIVDVEVAKLVDEHGAAPACTDILLLSEVADAVAPAALPTGVREALSRLGPYLDKVFAFDPRSQRGEKLAPRDPAASKVHDDVAHWLSAADVEIWAAPASPRLCVPVATHPPTVLLGREILGAPDTERQFLTARSIYLARSGLSSVLRAPPHELAAMLTYVAQQFEEQYQAVGVDPGLVLEQGRRLSKVAPRKVIEEVGPLVLEMIGAPEHDAAKLAMAVSELGDRVALLATGSMPAALSAILKLAGLPSESTDVAQRVSTVRRSPEALSLLHFAISEPCFEARRRSAAAR